MTSQIEDIWLNDGTQDLQGKIHKIHTITKSLTLQNL
jgi:hypothetical protein